MSRKHSPRFAIRLLGFFITILIMVSAASAEWKEKVLYSFQGGTDGAVPAGGVVFDKAGNLYGATLDGGSPSCPSPQQCGTVYQLAPPAHKGGAWTETVLYVFKGHNQNDGASPEGGLLIDKAGNLYGTTGYGGTGPCILLGTAVGCGTVFELSPPAKQGEPWTETVLYSFRSGNDGYVPFGDLVFDKAGNIYGATLFGGGKGTTCDPFYQYCGTVFKLGPPKTKGGPWTEKVLYSFKGVQSGKQFGDGANPNGTLIFDHEGSIYGLTSVGGFNCPHNSGQGCGTAFKLRPPIHKGAPWTEEILHRFAEVSDGVSPSGGLLFDPSGALYGTTFSGNNVDGTIFKLTPPSGLGRVWKETLLHTYATCGGNEGCSPSGLVFNSSGILFGGAEVGAHHAGLIFRLRPVSGGHSWQYTTAYSFAGPPDGSGPVYAFVFAASGRLFGTTVSGGAGLGCQGGCGTVVEVSP